MTVEAKVMEVKKTQQASTPAAKDAPMAGKKLFDFVGDIKTEFAKVTWTSPEELRTYTKIVVGATFAFGLGIYVVDLCIQNALNVLGYMFRLIFG